MCLRLRHMLRLALLVFDESGSGAEDAHAQHVLNGSGRCREVLPNHADADEDVKGAEQQRRYEQ